MGVILIFIFCIIVAIIINRLNIYLNSLDYHKLKLQKLKEDKEEVTLRLIRINQLIDEETLHLNKKLPNESCVTASEETKGS